jgi:hypothetical protein
MFHPRAADAAARPCRNDPVTFHHNYRVLNRLATSAVNQSRAGDDDRSNCKEHESDL